MRAWQDHERRHAGVDVNTFAPDGDDSIAIDGSGNVWLVANGNFVAKLSNAGRRFRRWIHECERDGPTGIALDGSGDAWVITGRVQPDGVQ